MQNAEWRRTMAAKSNPYPLLSGPTALRGKAAIEVRGGSIKSPKGRFTATQSPTRTQFGYGAAVLPLADTQTPLTLQSGVSHYFKPSAIAMRCSNCSLLKPFAASTSSFDFIGFFDDTSKNSIGVISKYSHI